MGMFDSFYFKDGVLPDNKVPEDYEFQTKDLDCCLDEYQVDKHGNVQKTSYSWDNKECIVSPDLIDCVAYVYSHDDNKYQEYAIMIVDSKLTHVKKIAESGYDDVDKSLDK